MKPVAKKSGIFRENLPEEVVLYDKTQNKVHCLNKTAAAVWENSDGSNTIDDLMWVVEMNCGGPADRRLVLQALEELEEAGLLEAGGRMNPDTGLPSRREAVGKMVMAGSALVATIVAAAPTAHASAGAPTYPPKLPISHNPPDPQPPRAPKGHNPPDPEPPSPPKGYNPPDSQSPSPSKRHNAPHPEPLHPLPGLSSTDPQSADPSIGLDPTNALPPVPLIGLKATNPQPPDPATRLTRPPQEHDFLDYFLRSVRLLLAHSRRVAGMFWRTGG